MTPKQTQARDALKDFFKTYEVTPTTFMDGEVLPGMEVGGDIDTFVKIADSKEVYDAQMNYYGRVFDRVDKVFTPLFKQMYDAFDARMSPAYPYMLNAQLVQSWFLGLEGPGGVAMLKLGPKEKPDALAIITVANSLVSEESKLSILGLVGDKRDELREHIVRLAGLYRDFFAAPYFVVVEPMEFDDASGIMSYKHTKV